MTVKRYHSYDTLVPPERRDVVLATDYDLLAADNAALRELLQRVVDEDGLRLSTEQDIRAALAKQEDKP